VNCVLVVGAAFNRVQMVQRSLALKDEDVTQFSATDEYDGAMEVAIRNGHANVVKLLLADARVDPRAEDNYAIGLGSKNGHASVVELLLADPRVNPSVRRNVRNDSPCKCLWTCKCCC
jgi:hypothetical protein